MPQQCIRGSEAGVLQYFEDETRRDLATKMLLDAFGSPETRDGRGDLHSALGVRLGKDIYTGRSDCGAVLVVDQTRRLGALSDTVAR